MPTGVVYIYEQPAWPAVSMSYWFTFSSLYHSCTTCELARTVADAACRLYNAYLGASAERRLCPLYPYQSGPLFFAAHGYAAESSCSYTFHSPAVSPFVMFLLHLGRIWTIAVPLLIQSSSYGNTSADTGILLR